MRIVLSFACLLLLTESPAPRIAFASHKDGNWEIYTMDGDGSHAVRLTANDVQDRFPIWSPDASQIAFGSQREGHWEL
jgi:Tol biopolymer transport system component